MKRISLAVIAIILSLGGCAESDNYAPVKDISQTDSMPRSGIYQVKPGQTLYEISWRYGLDYRFLANLNEIPEPFEIYPGQKIYLRKRKVSENKTTNILKPSAVIHANELSPTLKAASTTTYKEPNFSFSNWQLPTKGKVINQFSAVNKGLNFTGSYKQSVVAAGAGKVVYSGDGLRGYGNLIIIKHNGSFLSAYAHNHRNLVREGQWVKQGEQIAEMGMYGAKPLLHFEIRFAGKPVDPMQYSH